MVGSELGLSDGQHYLEELEGFGMAIDVGVAARQVVHADQRIAMIRSEPGLSQRQRLLPDLDGLRKPAESKQASSQLVHALKCVRIVGSAVLGIKCTRLLNLIRSDLRVSQESKGSTQCQVQPRFNEGLFTKSLVDEWRGRREGLAQSDLRPQSTEFSFRSRRSNHLLFQEVEHRFGLGLARDSVVFRLFLRLCRQQSILLRLSLAVGGHQSVPL